MKADSVYHKGFQRIVLAVVICFVCPKCQKYRFN